MLEDGRTRKPRTHGGGKEEIATLQEKGRKSGKIRYFWKKKGKELQCLMGTY